MKRTMKVAIGTASPSKREGIEKAFRAAFRNYSVWVSAFDVPSGVSEQPRSSDETLQGAWNRVSETKPLLPDGDFFVANESGIVDEGDHMYIINWVVIEDKHGQKSQNPSARFEIPPRVARHVRQGMELGPAFEMEFSHLADKRGIGGSGFMTKQIVTRSDLLFQATVMTLLPFSRPDLFGPV